MEDGGRDWSYTDTSEWYSDAGLKPLDAEEARKDLPPGPLEGAGPYLDFGLLVSRRMRQ